MAVALRAMKDIVEQVSGLRQGADLGAPKMFYQENAPASVGRLLLKVGDLWIIPSSRRMRIWTGTLWTEIAASP